jgi:putative zinc finger/helix-turn-helix YgiT family protein
MNEYREEQRRAWNLCVRCGAFNAAVKHRADVIDYKGLTLEVHDLISTECQECRFEWISAPQEAHNLALIKAAFVAKRDEVREREGLLTGEQISWVLDELRLSRAEAANVFGGGPNAFAKYIRGEVLQSVPMDRLLRLTVAFGRYAVEYLRLGTKAPLVLYAGGFIPVSGTAADPHSWEIEAADTANATPVQAVPQARTYEIT